VSSGSTSSFSTRSSRSFSIHLLLSPVRLSSLSFLLCFSTSFLHSSSRGKKTRSLRSPITTRPKSYVEFICRRCRHHELLVEIRPAILHVQIPGLASATVEIFYLYLISPLVRRRARCIRMIFIRVGETRTFAARDFPSRRVLVEADC